MCAQKDLESIIETAKKHNITAYEIGKNTHISFSTAYKIFALKNRNPKPKTINIIKNYLQYRIVAANKNKIPQNPNTNAATITNKINFEKLTTNDKLYKLFENQINAIDNLTEITTAIKSIKTKLT